MLATLIALVGGATAATLGTNLAAWYTAMGTRVDDLVGAGGQLGSSMWDSRVSLNSRVCPNRSVDHR